MALTVDEVAKITTDVTLGRKLRVKGPEAEAMAKRIKKEVEEIRAMGYAVAAPREVPEPGEK